MTNVRKTAWVTTACLAWLLLWQADALSAKEPKRPVAGPLITIRTPHPEQFEIALDEIELEWRDPRKKQITAPETPIMVYGARLIDAEVSRAVVAVSDISSPEDLSAMTISLKAANPGAEAHLVLFEPGLPRTRSTRRLLTREVGVLLEQGVDPHTLLMDLPADTVRSVPGVPEGYVIETVDPMAALAVADALQQRRGVRSAYPLLKYSFSPR